eukprot:2788750-Pyramimonas_sp.AAC.1
MEEGSSAGLQTVSLVGGGFTPAVAVLALSATACRGGGTVLPLVWTPGVAPVVRRVHLARALEV